MNKKHYGLTVLLSLILVLVLGQIPGVGATPAHAAESYKIKTSVSPAGTGNMSVTVNGREATTASPGDKVVVTSRPNNGQVVESLTATENDISTVPDLMDVMGDVTNGGTQYEITENYQTYVLHATDRKIITGAMNWFHTSSATGVTYDAATGKYLVSFVHDYGHNEGPFAVNLNNEGRIISFTNITTHATYSLVAGQSKQIKQLNVSRHLDTWTFTMPAGNVTVKMVNKPAPFKWFDGATLTFNEDETINGGTELIGRSVTLRIARGKTLTVNGGIDAFNNNIFVEGGGTMVINGVNGKNGTSITAQGTENNGGNGADGGIALDGNLFVDGATVIVNGGRGGDGGSSAWGSGGKGGNGGYGIRGKINCTSGNVIVNGGAGGNGGKGNPSFGADGAPGVEQKAVTGPINGKYRKSSTDNATWSDEKNITSNKRYIRVGVPYADLNDNPTISIKRGTTDVTEAPKAGDVLTAVSNATDLTYQWYRDDTPIANATGKTYVVTADDAGHTIKVTVTQTKRGNGEAYGESAPKRTSAPTAQVEQITAPTSPCTVTIKPGGNMTENPADASLSGQSVNTGNATLTAQNDNAEGTSQTGVIGPIEPMIFIAADGYYFPEDYSVPPNNGIIVTRDSYKQITVSGTPTGNVEITLLPPTAKTTPEAPTTAVVKDGKIIGVTTDMEYKKSDADEWTNVPDDPGTEITGLTPGTYYVRYKETDTTLPSYNQGLIIHANAQQEETIVTTPPAANLLIVDGQQQELVTAGTVTNGFVMQYALGNTTEATEPYSASIPKAAETGTYYVWYRVVKADDPQTVFVNPAVIPVAIYDTDTGVAIPPTAKNLTYTGSEQELVTPGKVVYLATGNPIAGVEMQYALGTNDKDAPANGWTSAVPKGTDANIYYVWCRVIEENNSGNVVAEPIVIPVVITGSSTDADNSIGAYPPTANNLTYTGKAQPLVTKGSIVDIKTEKPVTVYEMQYVLGADEKKAPEDGWKNTVPTGTDIGTYYVWCRVVKADESQEVIAYPIVIPVNISGTDNTTLYFAAHMQNIGWDKNLTELKPGQTADIGITGRSLRMEALAIMVPKDYTVDGFAHVQNQGDVAVKKVTSSKDYTIPDGYVAYEFGSVGKSQRVEAVCIGVKDASGEYVKGFQYATHLQNYGWQGYVRNGSFAGTRGMSLRMESLRFAYTEDDVVKAGEPKK